MKPEILIVGCGFLGKAAAELFSAQGRTVTGVVRTPETRSRLEELGFQADCCDVTDETSVANLTGRFSHVPLLVYCVSSSGGNARDYAALYRDGIRRIAEHWHPERLIFVSSTSVYSQSDGSWVTEDSPTLPERETARMLLEAEEIALKQGGTVLRLAGLYGPGRSLYLRRFLSGEATLEEGGGRYLNMIHRDDAASALLACSDPKVTSGIYNGVDDTPVTQGELFGWIAESLQAPLPPTGPSNTSRKRGIGSKRVRNAKLKSAGWNPRYPSFRDALPELLSFELR